MGIKRLSRTRGVAGRVSGQLQVAGGTYVVSNSLTTTVMAQWISKPPLRRNSIMDFTQALLGPERYSYTDTGTLGFKTFTCVKSYSSQILCASASWLGRSGS